MTQEEFVNSLMNTVDACIANVISAKPNDKKTLNFYDAIVVSGKIRGVFNKMIRKVPPQIEAVCNLSEALLAPSAEERTKRIKAVAGISGTVGGIGMIISGIGMGLGWGAGVVASVVTFFVGVSWAGPAIWITGGVALAAVAGYFALSGDEATKAERYIKALKGGLQEAMPSIWAEHGEELSK